MSKIILIASQKWGVGKSTTAVNIAAVLAHQGNDVLLVDSDRQASVSEWWAERKLNHPDNPKIACIQKYGELDDTLTDLSNRYQYVIVDVTGRDSEEMRSAMVVANVLLTPVKASQVDINTLPNMSRIIKSSRLVNKSLNAYAFLSIAPNNPRINEIEQAKHTILEFPELILLNTVVFDRKIYRDCMADGLSVTELNGRADSEVAARKETTALVEEVLHGKV